MTAKEIVQELTQKEFLDIVLKEKKKIAVVDFYAEWCMPCLMMTPILESVAERHDKEKAVFAKVNIDEAGELAQKYNISSIPCVIFFKKGEEAERIIGAVSEEEIERKMKELSD